MAGLSTLGTATEATSTTLPSWYSTAQQNLVNQAAGVQAPTPQQTTLGSATGAFGAQGPFQTGQGILQDIGSGAANPWLVSSTGQVSPNVNTALGGLFQAQTDYANKMMPDVQATATAPYISGGGFGSSMNLAAQERAKGQFLSDLFQKQMTAAIQNQQAGISAGAGLGNIGNQLVQGAINTATEQANLPYASAANQAKIMQAMGQQPTSSTKTVTPSKIATIGALGTLGAGAINSLSDTMVMDKYGNLVPQQGILSKMGISGGLPGVIKGISSFLPNLSSAPSTSETTQINNPSQPGDEAYGWQFYNNGVSIDPSGNYYQDGQMVYSPGWSGYMPEDSGLDLSGGDASIVDTFTPSDAGYSDLF